MNEIQIYFQFAYICKKCDGSGIIAHSTEVFSCPNCCRLHIQKDKDGKWKSSPVHRIKNYAVKL